MPRPQLTGRRQPVNRGKALGGSSSINSIVFIRGAPSDYDGWRDLGCAGWGWNDVLRDFKRIERNMLGQLPDWHGTAPRARSSSTVRAIRTWSRG